MGVGSEIGVGTVDPFTLEGSMVGGSLTAQVYERKAGVARMKLYGSL